MRRLFVIILGLALPGALRAAEPAAGPIRDQTDSLVDVAQREAMARRAGLRVLESNHLVLATDRPLREGDGVEEFPRVFDQAFSVWCHHYGMNPDEHRDWKSFGCLVVDRERFRAAGLLPDSLPPFENGYCDRNQFWLIDQSNPAYRRHLLLHEGAHAFTLTLRRLDTPVWYNEGIAEYLATHKLEPGRTPGTSEFVSTPIPERAEDVEQLGRIEKMQELRALQRAPSLADVLAWPPGNHKVAADYAASWAAVAMLAQHPSYGKSFATLERGRLGPDFNDRLVKMTGWDGTRASRDFDAFTCDIDYGYDFPRMAIDWSAGKPLSGSREIKVDAARGWQNTGLALTSGKRYAFKATGRVGLGSATDEPSHQKIPLEGEAEGITLAWYRGRPTGRLLVGQWVDTPQSGGRPRFEVLADGGTGEFAAIADGPLFMRLNGPPGQLATRTGTLSVTVRPLP